jgi:hypothetical protein
MSVIVNDELVGSVGVVKELQAAPSTDEAIPTVLDAPEVPLM